MGDRSDGFVHGKLFSDNQGLDNRLSPLEYDNLLEDARYGEEILLSTENMHDESVLSKKNKDNFVDRCQPERALSGRSNISLGSADTGEDRKTNSSLPVHTPRSGRSFTSIYNRSNYSPRGKTFSNKPQGILNTLEQEGTAMRDLITLAGEENIEKMIIELIDVSLNGPIPECICELRHTK